MQSFRRVIYFGYVEQLLLLKIKLFQMVIY